MKKSYKIKYQNNRSQTSIFTCYCDEDSLLDTLESILRIGYRVDWIGVKEEYALSPRYMECTSDILDQFGLYDLNYKNGLEILKELGLL